MRCVIIHTSSYISSLDVFVVFVPMLHKNRLGILNIVFFHLYNVEIMGEDKTSINTQACARVVPVNFKPVPGLEVRTSSILHTLIHSFLLL